MIGKTASDVEGKEFREVFPWLGEAVLTDVLSEKGKIIPRHCSFRANHGYFLPLLYSMMNRYPEPLYRSSVWRILQEAAKKRFRMYIFRVLQPKKTFRDVHTENRQMKEVLDRARKYALSDAPVLIHGEVGTEYAMIAEAIHNNSVRHAGPFVSINVREIDPEKQINVLFGGEPGKIRTDMRLKAL